MTPAEFNVWMHTKVSEWAAVVKEAGIRVE
jgi:hypothetical protein